MRILKISLLILAVVTLSACGGKKKKPTPADTATMGGYPASSSDYIISTPVDTGIYGPGAVELENRGDISDGGTYGSNQQEGIIPSVYFDFDQTSVRPSERDKLSQAASYLSQNPGARLLIEGHCDWRGTAEYNLALGDRRANSVKQYLITLGVDPNRLETVSQGDLEAVAGGTASQMAQDRRADIIVLQ